MFGIYLYLTDFVLQTDAVQIVPLWWMILKMQFCFSSSKILIIIDSDKIPRVSTTAQWLVHTVTRCNMVEIIEIRREHQSKVWGFQKELEDVNWCVRNLRVMRVPRKYPHTCMYDTYWYIFKKMGKHQSKNLMMGRFFLKKNLQTSSQKHGWVLKKIMEHI